MGRVPKVFVWDGLAMLKKFELTGNGIVRSIMHLAFSPSGKFLAVMDESDDHNVAIYDSENGSCVTKSKGIRGKVILGMEFKNETTFVSVGANHFYEWSISSGSIKKTAGKFGQNSKLLCSVAMNGTTALTGTKEGALLTWNGTTAGQSKKLHTSNIDAVTVTSGYVFTGARDKTICVLAANNYAAVLKIDLSSWNSVCAQPRAISLDSTKKSLAIGTFAHELVSVPINLQSKTSAQPTFHVHGHYAPKKSPTTETWGLSVFPNKEQFYVSSSEDGTVRIWDATNHKQHAIIDLTVDKDGKKIPLDTKYKDLAEKCQSRAVEVNPSGNTIAVAMFDGSVKAFKAPNWTMIFDSASSKKQPKEWV